MQDSKLSAVTSIVGNMAAIIAGYMMSPQETILPEAMQTVSALYQQKANGDARSV